MICMPEAFLTPVTRTTVTADICRQLVSHLLRGDWTEGQRIPAERELCQQLAVGRASLREAMKALEIMGMIETRLGDGTFVCARSRVFVPPASMGDHRQRQIRGSGVGRGASTDRGRAGRPRCRTRQR